jgi:hypothetical protein
MALMFMSPIFYPKLGAAVNLRQLFELNPLARSIERGRAVVIAGALPDPMAFAINCLIARIVAWAGLVWFMRTKHAFADVLWTEAAAAAAEGDERLAIAVQGLSKCYQIYAKPRDRLAQTFWGGRRNFYREFHALHDVSFELAKGEASASWAATGRASRRCCN